MPAGGLRIPNDQLRGALNPQDPPALCCAALCCAAQLGGLGAGGAVAFTLFIAGLVLSHGGSTPEVRRETGLLAGWLGGRLAGWQGFSLVPPALGLRWLWGRCMPAWSFAAAPSRGGPSPSAFAKAPALARCAVLCCVVLCCMSLCCAVLSGLQGLQDAARVHTPAMDLCRAGAKLASFALYVTSGCRSGVALGK